MSTFAARNVSLKDRTQISLDSNVSVESTQNYSPRSGSEIFSFNSIITLNISGNTYQTFDATLKQFPNTLLGSDEKRKPFYNRKTNEFIFFTHRTAFEAILYYYQSNGKFLIRPAEITLDVFLEELRFFQIKESRIQKWLLSEGLEPEEKIELPENKVQRVVYKLMEEPHSSPMAKFIAFFSTMIILISLASFCAETVPSVGSKKCRLSKFSDADCIFGTIEATCIVWFTIELLLRFLSSPNKKCFFFQCLNIFDVIAVAPFYIGLVLPDSGGASLSVLRIVRLVRVLIIFKLTRHSQSLQTFGKAMKDSLHDLFLLAFFLGIILILCGSVMYYVEYQGNNPDKIGFRSIPEAFWFSLVTVTSVGYGDVTPTTTLGKMFATIFMIIGILVCSLPLVVIVENFDRLYRQQVVLKDLENCDSYQKGIKE